MSSRKRGCWVPTTTLSEPSGNFWPTRPLTGSCLLACYACPWASLWRLTQHLSGKYK